MNGAVNSPFLSRQRISVSTRGDMVRLEIGNGVIDMPYETALQLGMWLRVNGKKAKSFAGDSSRSWRAAAFLENLQA